MATHWVSAPQPLHNVVDAGVALAPIGSLSMYYTIDSTTFTNYWGIVISCAFGACTAILLYGTLLVLLLIATYLLYHRAGAGRRSLSAATALMALLATAQLGIRLRAAVAAFQVLRLAVEGELWPQSARAVSVINLFDNLYIVDDFLLVTNNLVTDSLFIYRCFIVWNHNIRIAVIPILLLLTTTVIGYLSVYEDEYVISSHYLDFRVAFIMSVVTNVALMALTAGRIWWIRRDACVLLESASVRMYTTVIAIILESGALYCISVLIYVISISVLNQDNDMIAVFRAAMPQIMNIAPTLIIVRVGLGHGVRVDEVRANSDREHRALPRVPFGAPAATFGVRAPARDQASFVIDIRAARENDNDNEAGDNISLSELGKRV
ncbi:hypothetical protein DFH07DRAFT_789743 [Mycena maculata]|uniref:Uncharacterized protein n=1 Tax=Mycena maculata TaxID=230809 RepID=A0AAD7P1R5_9AGAR|nr:hypothetical protein DFH07DRAFT_789743 [Mycena maculata]